MQTMMLRQRTNLENMFTPKTYSKVHIGKHFPFKMSVTRQHFITIVLEYDIGKAQENKVGLISNRTH
jgi:hypothetical protein